MLKPNYKKKNPQDTCQVNKAKKICLNNDQMKQMKLTFQSYTNEQWREICPIGHGSHEITINTYSFKKLCQKQSLNPTFLCCSSDNQNTHQYLREEKLESELCCTSVPTEHLLHGTPSLEMRG